MKCSLQASQSYRLFGWRRGGRVSAVVTIVATVLRRRDLPALWLYLPLLYRPQALLVGRQLTLLPP
jgi:hypothetical protein